METRRPTPRWIRYATLAWSFACMAAAALVPMAYQYLTESGPTWARARSTTRDPSALGISACVLFGVLVLFAIIPWALVEDGPEGDDAKAREGAAPKPESWRGRDI